MKIRSWVIAIVVAVQLIGLPGADSARAAVNIQFSAGLEIQSASDFYQPLQDYGRWVDVPKYGRCWHPAQVESDWRPYAVGHWEWTDCGWYWVSDEPWSWATYHYGGWVFDASYGWMWVPGTEWAPAWVSWRESSDYVGWAPCGPGGISLAPSLFVFVDVHHFNDRFQPHNLIINNTTVVNRTRVVGGGFQRESRDFGGRQERVVVNRGPGVDAIQRSTGRQFTAKPVTQVVEQTAVPSTIRRRTDSGINRQTLPEQPKNQRERTPDSTQNQRQFQNDQSQHQGQGQVPPTSRNSQIQPSAPNDRAPVPNVSNEQERRNLAPTGREQPNVRNQPERHATVPSEPSNSVTPPREAIPGATPKPAAPPTEVTPPNRHTPEATGRDQQRVYQQQPEARPEQRPEAKPVAPSQKPTVDSTKEVRPSLPAIAREKILTPTGRDETRKFEAPPRAEPSQRVEPKPSVAPEQPRREEPKHEEAPGREHDKEKP